MTPIPPRSSEHLAMWCKHYQEAGTVPQPRHIRFGIGVYQITQGMSWKAANPVRWQSFCAASMHFIMCAEAYDIPVSGHMPVSLEYYPEAHGGRIWQDLLMSIGKAQQQIIYHPSISSGSTRASRFNKDKLCDHLLALIERCFSMTPQGYREQGCYDEMKILTGDLPV